MKGGKTPKQSAASSLPYRKRDANSAIGQGQLDREEKDLDEPDQPLPGRVFEPLAVFCRRAIVVAQWIIHPRMTACSCLNTR